MILYNSSLSDGLRNFTRFLTNTNTTTYTNADLDASLNSYYDMLAGEILDSMDEWDFQGEYATTDLVASQQEYSLPSDILKIKRVEISYDGTNWYPAAPMDINERNGALDSTSVASDFSTSAPYFDLMDNSLFLYPIPTAASTAGLKIWYEKNVTHLSAATDEPNIAKPFHKALAYGAAIDWLDKYAEVGTNQNKSQLYEAKLEKMISRMKNFYRKHNQDRKYTIEPNYVDYGYGNE
jgi:hypothetical protein